MDIQPFLPYAPWLASGVALVVGFLFGRRGQGAERRRELEGELSVMRGLEEEGRSAREELEQRLAEATTESDAYKQKVVDHFYGTSEQLRSLTLQYRSVFDHLADGARELCPDEIAQLDGEFGVPVLHAGEALEVDSATEAPAPVSAEPEAVPDAETSAGVEAAPAAEGEAADAAAERQAP